jgi:hypothetical protein
MPKNTDIPVAEIKYFADKNGKLFTVMEQSETHVRILLQGGGFTNTLPNNEFVRNFTPIVGNPFSALKPVRITADWFEPGVSVAAYSAGELWNGWAVPYFTHEAVLELMKLMPDMPMEYVVNKDAFVSRLVGVPEEDSEMVVPGEFCDTVNGRKKLYPVGAWNWCWDEVDEPAIA